MKNKALFESWLVNQFGSQINSQLKFCMEDGYKDHAINAMWIGFNAGIELTNS
ncbi:MAG: hypothetical protein VX100_07405 [Pseudomonadota bacterium]|nr:hypothetical protein [Pseudomonadota bacterium]